MPLVFNPTYHTKTSKQWRFIVGLLAILIACTVSNTATADLTMGLVANWSFDDCNAKDNSGNGNDGVIKGNPSCVDGPKSKAFSFNGTTDYIHVKNSSSLNMTQAISFGGFVNLTELNPKGGDDDIIINKEGIPFELGIRNNVTAQACLPDVIPKYNFAFYIDIQKKISLCWADGGKKVSKNTWTHLFITYDGVQVNTYFDGVLVKTYPMTGTITITGQALRIAARGGEGTPSYLFNGVIDDLRVYNRALTAVEVKELSFVVVEKPIISATPKSLNFGKILVGKVAKKTVTLSNTGTGTLDIGTLSITGTSASDYQLIDNTCDTQSLAPKATCTFNVSFKPITLGTRNAEVVVPSNVASTSNKITLTGEGISTDILGNFIDLNSSTIDYVKNTIKIKLIPEAKAYFDINLTVGKTKKSWLGLVGDSNSEINITDLPSLKEYPDQLVKFNITKYSIIPNRDGATVLSDGTVVGIKTILMRSVLYGIVDRISVLNKNAIVNSKIVSQTKPVNTMPCVSYQRIKSVCNNFFESAESASDYSKTNGAVFRNTLSHRIIDFDKIANVPSINAIWSKTTYGKTPKGDNARIPLILIHGWQGDKNMRSPVELGLWNNSELHYWQHFLDYYLATPALQTKYHVYLYHYPTYKHITYNAFILNGLLNNLHITQAKSDLATGMKGKGVVVLAHSMGGLVARSANEEYQAFGVSGNKLKKLITLDTPHHGSDGALTDTWNAKQEIAQFFVKDAYTQGSADLQWDNFDLHVVETMADNIAERQKKDINSKDFDASYREACKNDKYCKPADLSYTSNPWLAWLNKDTFSGHLSAYSKKYLLYAGWMIANSVMSSPVLNNPLSFEHSDPVLRSLSHLPSGGAASVSSALWYDLLNNTKPFTITGDNEAPSYIYQDKNCVRKLGPNAQSWFGGVNSNIRYKDYLNYGNGIVIPFFMCGNSILISKETTHPLGFDYRVFWDYDHEFMVNGAYLGKVGVWDEYINKEIIILGDPKKVNGSKYSALNNIIQNLITNKPVRNSYITIAFSYMTNSENTYKFTPTSPGNYNPLRLEPLFNVLQRDLLDTAKF